MFLAKYNEQTRKLNYINAGHNATMVYADKKVTELKLGTTMIGVFDELPFINQGEIVLAPGSLVVNYTDGLMDHENPVSKNWNEESLINFVKAHGELSPEHFNDKLMDHINHVVKGKPIDDITLLTLKIF